jgi:hypothetical protein
MERGDDGQYTLQEPAHDPAPRSMGTVAEEAKEPAQEREVDRSPGTPSSGAAGQADEQAQVWPSPGAMVGITIPDPPEQDASRTDGAHSGPERDEDDAPQ